MPIVSHPWRVIEGVLALGDEPHRLAVAAAWATSVSVSDLPALAASSGLPRAEADLAFDRLVAAGVLELPATDSSSQFRRRQAAPRRAGPARRAALEPIHDTVVDRADHRRGRHVERLTTAVGDRDVQACARPPGSGERRRPDAASQARSRPDVRSASPGGSRPGDRPARVTRAERSSRGLRTGGGGTPIGQPPRRGGVDLDAALGDPAMCSPRLLLARAAARSGATSYTLPASICSPPDGQA